MNNLEIQVYEGNVIYNIYERLDKYVIEINAIGLSKEELDINYGNNIIRVRSNPEDCIECNVESYDVLEEKFKKEKFRCKIFYPNIKKVVTYLNVGILTLDIFKKVESTIVNFSDKY